MIELQGLTGLVTGGTSGIGLATAMALVEGGANVAINARRPNPEVLSILNQRGAERGARAIFVPGDASLPETSADLAGRAIAEFGRIDTVVHCAGGPASGTALDISPDKWLEAFSIHVHSTYHLFRAAHAGLATTQGSMTLLSSAAALRGCPGTVAYQVVKGALIAMARALARDHAAEGIRVNCVAPGIIRTPFQHAMTEEARLNNLANRIPLQREGTPEGVAALILHLIENDFITGETMVIDGGMSMRMV